MRLKSRRFSSKRVGILSTLILVLALAIQPLSPMVMRIAHASLDPAETTPSSPSLGSLAPVLWDGDNYKGINIDLSLKDITGLSSFTATIHRADDSTVVKTMKQARIDWVNSRNGAATSLTIPFVVQALSYDESTSGSWSLPSTTIWTSASVPQSVTVDMTFADSSKNFTKTSPINTRGIDYLSLLPVSSNPHTTIVAPTGIVGNKFTVSGLATDDEALNRVYVQLVYRGDSQRYGGKTINLIGEGAKAEWSHEFDAVKLNLSDGQYAAHAQAVDMKGNRYDTGWTTNFTVDRTGPAISNVTPATGTSVKSDFTVSANVSDPNGVKKIALYVYDQATDTKVKEYPLSNTEGDAWTAQVKLADLRGDAVYDLRFRAVDNLNNVTYHNNRGGAYLVTVDRTSPAFSNIEISPMINGNIGGTVRIAVDLTDDSGVDTNIKYTFIRFFANNREYSYEFTKVAGTESTYEAIVNTRDFVRTNTFAKVNASLRFQDVLGNGRSTKPEVLQGVGVDNSGPGSRLVSPSGGAMVRGTTRFVVEATDHTGTKSGYIKVNGQTYGLAKAEAEDGYWYADVDTTSWSDGSYRVEARLVDLFGQPRYNSNIGSVQVDNTAPTASISVSNENPKVGETVTVIGSVTNEDNIKSHWFEILKPDGTTTFHRYNMNSRDDSFSFEIKDLELGVYRIRYVATDRAGNRNDDPNHKNPTILTLNVNERQLWGRKTQKIQLGPADGAPESIAAPAGLAFGGFGFGFTPAANVVQPGADDEEEVLAEEDNRLESERGSVLNEADNAMENADKEQTSGFMKFLGDWWWLILLGILTLGLLWWIIAAVRRRKDEEEQ